MVHHRINEFSLSSKHIDRDFRVIPIYYNFGGISMYGMQILQQNRQSNFDNIILDHIVQFFLLSTTNGLIWKYVHE